MQFKWSYNLHSLTPKPSFVGCSANVGKAWPNLSHAVVYLDSRWMYRGVAYTMSTLPINCNHGPQNDWVVNIRQTCWVPQVDIFVSHSCTEVWSHSSTHPLNIQVHVRHCMWWVFPDLTVTNVGVKRPGYETLTCTPHMRCCFSMANNNLI